ncbi:MAG TPA: thioesterase domain-containing protein, partial [Verrucomicrobiae bacterium]|nr:thioesterase domain-containing protein [Verrucomicrobiae bacterium]
SGAIDLAALPTPPKVTPAVRLVSDEQRAAPTDIETKLIAIWREQLGVQQIDRDSHFFDLGGHSLLAVRMVTQASVAFGAKLDVLALFKAPTIHQFAEHIASVTSHAKSVESDDWKIVPLQPNGEKRPFIVLNNTILYYGLAKQFGQNQPLYGVQNYKPDADAPEEVRSLEEIAADYVKLVRAVQPKGPYKLIGLCVAGIIAYEVAQQLAADGEEPPTVIMFDSWAPGYAQSLPKHKRLLRDADEWFHYQKRRFQSWRAGEITTVDFLLRYNFIQRIVRAAVALGIVKKMPEREFLWHPGFEGYLSRARSAYRPKAYAGDVLMFRSDEFPTGPLHDRKMGWDGIVKGRLAVKDISGGHLNVCAGENAVVVATNIDAFLSNAS